MNWRKYVFLERRRDSRHPVAIDVEFYIWNERTESPLTARAKGCLINISKEGACLKTNTVRMAGYHLLLNNSLDGETPLILEFQKPWDGGTFTVKSNIIWYNRSHCDREYRFEFGLAFLCLSPAQEKFLTKLRKSSR